MSLFGSPVVGGVVLPPGGLHGILSRCQRSTPSQHSQRCRLPSASYLGRARCSLSAGGGALGRRAALVTALGNSAGVYAPMVFVAFGLGAIVARNSGNPLPEGPRHCTDSEVIAFRVPGGFIVGVTNPKAIVFFAAILPQFVTETGPPSALQMGVLGVVFVAVALLSDGTWGMAAGSARQWLAR